MTRTGPRPASSTSESHPWAARRSLLVLPTRMVAAARAAHASLPEDDLGRVFHLFGAYTWFLLALCAVVVVYSAFANGGDFVRGPIGIVVLGSLLVTLLLVATPSPTPLPLRRTFVVVAVSAVGVLLVRLHVGPENGTAAHYTWELIPVEMSAYALTIRGRMLSAWILQAVVIAAFVIWSVFATGSPEHGFLISYWNVFHLLACSLFAVALRRTAREVVAHRAVERERATADARSEALARHLETELRTVRELAEPTLAQIAAGARPDASAVRGLEAELRDRIRGRSFVAEPLSSVLRAARERGVEVVVLDDLGDVELAPDERMRVVRWAASEASSPTMAGAASMTLRLALDAGAPLVTLSGDGALCADLRLARGSGPDQDPEFSDDGEASVPVP